MQTPASKPRVLLITRNLPPLVGGMERMMQQLAQGINQYAELTVIGPKGCTPHLPLNATVHETSASLGLFLLLSTRLAINACRTSHFDVVIGGSGLTAPTLRILALLLRRKTLVYLHGLDLVVDSAIYQKLFIPCLRHIDSIAVNSRNTLELAVGKGIDETRMHIVHPGASPPTPVESGAGLDFRQRYAIPFERYMVFVGRMTKRKGLSYFLQHILPLILENEPRVGLVVVGSDPADSLNRLGEQAEILHHLSDNNTAQQIVFLGKISDRDLQICYADAEVQIFPLIQIPGDVEGFGMVAIEAAACGTPTVAFDLGGVADAISAQNGHLVPPGQPELFAASVLTVLRGGEPNSALCVAHARNFTWQAYNEKMRALISRLLRQQDRVAPAP
jgi:phosphatidylinositol alpha-1,6-mannosyltransferase